MWLWSMKTSASAHQKLSFGYITEAQRQPLSIWIPKWRWHGADVMWTCNVGFRKYKPFYPDWYHPQNVQSPPVVCFLLHLLHVLLQVCCPPSNFLPLFSHPNIYSVSSGAPVLYQRNSPASLASPQNVSFTSGPYLNPGSPLEASLPEGWQVRSEFPVPMLALFLSKSPTPLRLTASSWVTPGLSSFYRHPALLGTWTIVFLSSPSPAEFWEISTAPWTTTKHPSLIVSGPFHIQRPPPSLYSGRSLWGYILNLVTTQNCFPSAVKPMMTTVEVWWNGSVGWVALDSKQTSSSQTMS